MSARNSKQVRPWRHAESTYTLATGGDKFGQFLKKQAFKFVRVVTDDAQIDFGLLIRDDEDNQIRVGHRVSVPLPLRTGEEYYTSPLNQRRRYEWRLDAVARERIQEVRTLS
jgi:hypothetical protein